ncbi:hypothetical protein NDU88_003795 [Pleurodeles waltl]|uniref:Uncharacterized protein n=1 Tax=Pleurodeles waltl TaxID=8319 RepID=A0AAV7T7P1_PLEWA|nr:hypothetical protein NDU88_003795 [Pleurodeles waltl]
MLAVSCDYKACEDEMIRDQLVEKTNNKKVQETLLSTPNLTLEKAVEIETRIESTTMFMQQINTAGEKDSFQKVAMIKQKSNKSHVNVKAETSVKKENLQGCVGGGCVGFLCRVLRASLPCILEFLHETRHKRTGLENGWDGVGGGRSL